MSTKGNSCRRAAALVVLVNDEQAVGQLPRPRSTPDVAWMFSRIEKFEREVQALVFVLRPSQEFDIKVSLLESGAVAELTLFFIQVVVATRGKLRGGKRVVLGTPVSEGSAADRLNSGPSQDARDAAAAGSAGFAGTWSRR
jgi:hypothetical protein